VKATATTTAANIVMTTAVTIVKKAVAGATITAMGMDMAMITTADRQLQPTALGFDR